MKREKTAVEWYDSEMNQLVSMLITNQLSISRYNNLKQKVLNQAKQMEKEQIGLAFIVGYAHGSVDSGLTAKEYYSERYENKAENND